MEFSPLTPLRCAELARDIFDKKTGYSNKTDKALDDEICTSLIGTSYIVCTEIWNLIDPINDDELRGAHPKHLFWALLFLFTYCTEPILTRVVGGIDSKTLRRWVWLFVRKIADLKPGIIILDNRFRNWDGISVCLMSLDGIDCPIREPWPFDTEVFSHKFNGPAYKYEVGSCIKTGDIVWVNGPFKAGKGDDTIVEELIDQLADDECLETDGGYKGSDRFKGPNVSQSRRDRGQKNTVRARQENINGRLKQFSVLDNVFRHDLGKHQMCFHAVAVITQLRFRMDKALYNVDYNVRYD